MRKEKLNTHLRLLENDFDQLAKLKLEDDFLIYLGDLKTITYTIVNQRIEKPNVQLKSLFSFYLESAIRIQNGMIPSIDNYFEINQSEEIDLILNRPLEIFLLNKVKLRSLDSKNLIRDLMINHSSLIIENLYKKDTWKQLCESIFVELNRSSAKKSNKNLKRQRSPDIILKEFQLELNTLTKKQL